MCCLMTQILDLFRLSKCRLFEAALNELCAQNFGVSTFSLSPRSATEGNLSLASCFENQEVMNEVMYVLSACELGEEREEKKWEGLGGQALWRAKVGVECGLGIQAGKDGRVEQEGLWKGGACKHWLLLRVWTRQAVT